MPRLKFGDWKSAKFYYCRRTGCDSSISPPHHKNLHPLKMTQNDRKCHFESFLGDGIFFGEGGQYSCRTLYTFKNFYSDQRVNGFQFLCTLWIKLELYSLI